MSFGESLVVALICMVIVFIVLAVLFFLISILSKVVGAASGKKSGTEVPGEKETGYSLATDQTAAVKEQADGLVLNNVDERTAAMIMAIVSYETKTPLDQLVFKSISAID